MVCKEMRSTIGCKAEESWVKNELHLVTDGHDKKLKLKQPFFKCCEEVRATPPQRVASWEKKLFELFHESCWKTRFSQYFSACKRKDDSPEHPQQPKKPRLVFTDLQRRTLQAIFKVCLSRLDVLSPTIQIGSNCISNIMQSCCSWRSFIHHIDFREQ